MSLNINRFFLENGLEVLHCKMPTNDISLVYAINAGSLYEDANQAGLAHLVEHVLFKGTYKRKNREEIYAEKTSFGTDIFCHTGWKNVELGMRVLKENFENILEFTEDILLNSIFTNNDIETEKNIVLDEMRIGQDNNFLAYEFYKTLFEGHPYARPIIGYENTVLNLNVDEVKKFYQHHYVPSNIDLVVAGDIGINYLKNCLERTFKGIVEFPKPELKKLKTPKNKKREIIFSKERENSEFFMGKILPKITETYETTILSSILSKKIDSNLLDKYSTSYFRSFSLGNKLMYACASCKKEYNKFVRDVIKNNITRIKNKDFTTEDIEVVIKRTNNSFILNSQSSMYIAKTILNCWPNKLHNLNWLNTYGENISKITRDDVIKVAKKYLSIDDLTTVILGDF